mgnify:FL=1
MVTFANGLNFETTVIYAVPADFQGAKRDTLDIAIRADKITLDEAKAIWQNSNATSEITITYEELVDEKTVTKTGVHINYTLPMALTLDVLNGEQIVHIKLAQKSALELTQEKQAQDMDDVNAALCELAELIAGGEDNG